MCAVGGERRNRALCPLDGTHLGEGKKRVMCAETWQETRSLVTRTLVLTKHSLDREWWLLPGRGCEAMAGWVINGRLRCDVVGAMWCIQ